MKEEKKGYGKLLDAWEIPSDGGQAIGCLATSFTFSSVFFEEECLSRFLGLESDPEEDGPLYLLDREEKLQQVSCAAALVDQSHCRGPRSLRWDLHPVRLKGGILHAKVAILWWTGRVRLIVGSANLTEDGYRRNQEIFGVLDFHEGSKAPLACLLAIAEYLEGVAQFVPGGPEGKNAARDRCLDFLAGIRRLPRSWGVGDESRQDVIPVLIGPGRPSLFQAASEIWPGGAPPSKARIMSPFFDPPGMQNQPGKEIWNVLKKRGAVHVEYHTTCEDIPGKKSIKSHIPREVFDAAPHGRDNIKVELFRVAPENNRPLHAKAIWFQNERRVLYLIGSSNFTSPGLGLSNYPNLEVNLAYLGDSIRGSNSIRNLKSAFLPGEHIKDLESVEWPVELIDLDRPGDDVVALHPAFGSVIFSCGTNGESRLALNLLSSPPKGWAVSKEEGQILLEEANWLESGSPMDLKIVWKEKRIPSELYVSWDNSNGKARWPVNVESTTCLPLPEQLRDLPLDLLLDLITSARPLIRVIGKNGRKKGKNGNDGDSIIDPALDPHKRVSTEGFILQRTRKITWALNNIRKRLEEPVPTREALEWRLRGPVGALALLNAITREGKSDAEKCFLLAELALELDRAKPIAKEGFIKTKEVKEEIRNVIVEIHEMVQTMEGIKRNFSNYVDGVFKEILG